MASPGSWKPTSTAAATTAISSSSDLVFTASSFIPSVLNSPTSDPKSSILLLPHPSWPLIRRFFLFFLSILLRFFLLIISLLFPLSSPSSSHTTISNSSSSSSPPTRALSHLLSVISIIPVSSRKYHFARSLADRLLDENLISSPSGGLGEVNRAALLEAFEHTIRKLEAVVPRSGGGPMNLIAGGIWAGLRRVGVVVREIEGGGGSMVAEKLASEVLWLAQKMTECGTAREAVARWAAAASALIVEARIQVAFVRISVFMFRKAHRMQVESCHHDHNEEEDEPRNSISQNCISMLHTWLPLLCRASNGIDAPILNSSERTEMVRVLDDMIEKLNWEQQEEILALWLHHFTSCPDSDWPNLESAYTRWYAMSRKLLLQ
ncbi:LOW QUALITY PROTEIN: uncharacterized protein LOC110025539 [Phalaenopsis equestris]|uniref:LOW QUALITY PROTEIN: uncharacterized protein LOC110025539 n=1 Tax=Phalaenopsis equestris TaxID=78828 RepID=UPI0009E42359|nr:LOW QUALITY PROTEIN: uncharacterized protein LOC110025539 [Phalaenopsis equestris]